MRAEDFSPEMQSRLVRTVQDQWAFVPDLLPPALEFDLPAINQIIAAERSVAELRGLTRNLPNPMLLVRPFMSREAVLSSRIEGTMADVEQLLLFEDSPDRLLYTDAEEVSNYFEALQLGLRHLGDGGSISLWLIRQLHQRLMQGVRGSNKNPGEIRQVQNAVGSRGQSLQQATYVPPPPGDVMPLLENLEAFINMPSDLPLLVRVALMHYQFEAIHPFLDGNGRIGRLLIVLMLASEQALPLPLLSVSAYFEENRNDYYDGLLAASQMGDIHGWIALFNEAVTTQAADAIKRSEQLLDLRDRYVAQLREVRASVVVLTLLDQLFERPSITIPRAADQLGVTRRTATLSIEKLESAGIIREITGQERYRIWMAPEIIRCLND